MASGTWGPSGSTHIFRVSIRWMAEGQRMQTGFHLRDLAVADNSCEDVANAVDPWLMGHFRTILGSGHALEAIDVTRLASEEGFTKNYVATFGTFIHGGPNTLLPTFTAVSIALKTQRRKKYGQGRMFWPVEPESYVDTNTLSAGAVTAYQAILDNLMDLFSGSVITHDLALVNVHGILPPRAATPTSPARPEIPASWYDVEAVKLNTAVTMLRSRKAGRGQ